MNSACPEDREPPAAAVESRRARLRLGERDGWVGRTVVVLALLVLLKLIAPLAITLLVSLLLFMLLGPAVEALQRSGMPAAAGAAAVVFAPSLLCAGAVFVSAPAASAWWQGIAGTLARLAQQLQVIADAHDALHLTSASARWLLARPVWDSTALGATFTADAGPLALAAAAVLMLVFFLLLAQRSLLAAMLNALPDRRARIRALGALRDARRGVATYLGTMALINLGLAVATGVALAAIGVASSPAWTVAVFLLLFIPYLGPLAAALLLAAAAHAEPATFMTIAAPPAIFLVLHAIEAHLVSPWIMGRRLSLGRPALLVAVLAGAWAWGVVGGLLAVPLLIAAEAVLRRRPGHALVRALLAGEGKSPPSLADSYAAALAPSTSRRAGRVRPMPMLVDKSPSPCESPTSPKPTRPKSTASR